MLSAHSNSRSFILFSLLLISTYLASALLLAHIFLSWDVSWLLHATRRMLAGGHYFKDFPEGNPPMILYMYAPVVLIAKTFSANWVLVFYGYIYFLISLALVFCYRLACVIFIEQRSAYLFLLFFASASLILPFYEFGQREHLLFILIMPYLLMKVARIKKIPLSPLFAFCIAILAGFGFAIKPHYLIVWLGVECYDFFKRKPYRIASETLVILSILFLYVISVFLFHLDYITDVLPLIVRNYYSSVSADFLQLILHPILFYVAFVLLLYRIQYHDLPQKELSDILLISLFGFLLAYLLQHTLWYYHLLPLYATAFLLCSLVFASLLKQEQHFFLSMGYFCILFFFPLHYGHNVYQYCQYYVNKLRPLQDYLQHYAKNKPVYFFATTPTIEFPAVDYAGALPASRFAVLNWVPNILKTPRTLAEKWHKTQDKHFFIATIAAELNQKKPAYVFVDVLANKPYIKNRTFDYITYFSQDSQFQKAWLAYQYQTTMDASPLYRFDVYQRRDL